MTTNRQRKRFVNSSCVSDIFCLRISIRLYRSPAFRRWILKTLTAIVVFLECFGAVGHRRQLCATGRGPSFITGYYGDAFISSFWRSSPVFAYDVTAEDPHRAGNVSGQQSSEIKTVYARAEQKVYKGRRPWYAWILTKGSNRMPDLVALPNAERRRTPFLPTRPGDRASRQGGQAFACGRGFYRPARDGSRCAWSSATLDLRPG